MQLDRDKLDYLLVCIRDDIEKNICNVLSDSKKGV